MASSLASKGYNLAMNIVSTFPPKYWKKEDYASEQCIIKEIHEDSNEFNEISNDIYDAEDKYESDHYDNVDSIERVQNPYTYSRFILRKRFMKLRNGKVYQVRRFKLIEIRHIDLALEFNCDGRHFGQNSADLEFFTVVPEIPDDYALLVLQVLTSEKDETNDTIICENDSEFYIEYIVYF